MATITDTCYLFIIWFISTLLVYFFTNKLLKSNGKMARHPPSPPALPVIGHIHLLGKILPKSLQTLASRYGPLMRISIGSSTSLIVSDATVAGEVMKAHDLNFSLRPDFGSSDFRIYNDSFLSAGDGTCRRFLRKVCVTRLLSTQQLNQSIDIRKQELMKLLEVVLKCSEKSEACDVGAVLMTMTNNIICRMTMNARCSASANESQKIREFVSAIGELGAKLSFGEVLGPLKNFDLFGYGRRLRSLLIKFDKLVEGIMKEKEERHCGEREREDMMDVLLQISKDETAQVKVARNDIKFFFLVMFLAGTDSTTAAMQWTLAELINHPDALEKLREEIMAVVGPNRLVEESDVPNLPYLQAVVKESLRMHPPLPFILRMNKEDCNISGYHVLANSRMMINVHAIMQNPDSWTNPTEFLPDRFLGSTIKDSCNHDQHDEEEKLEGQKLHYLPFGSGRRACPGAALATTVTQAGIAALVQCFDWEIKGGREKVDMEMGLGISAGMAHPLVCYPIMHINPLKLTTTLAK